MSHNIVLTGFMGTGKSTIGRLLAQQLGYEFVDTDEVIVAQHGRSIADIFRDEGETVFRQYEAEVAQLLAERTELVIATGGGLMLFDANVAALSRHGRIFCLTAEPDEIVHRLENDGGTRPLLAAPDATARIRELLQEREAGYGRFTRIHTDGKTPTTITGEIMTLLNPQRLPVSHPTGQYDVIVGYDLLGQIRPLANLTTPLVVITDDQVGPLYAHRLEAPVITIAAGERHKTLDTVRQIYDEMLALGIDRKGTAVALGGGVVGDMTGFVAATYMRGINFVQCPTTLLAMVDASVGGKTGVDLPQGKNLIGAFKQPLAVIADLGTLPTLPPAEFTSGMAEVVKHGLLVGGDLWQRLEAGDWALKTDTEQAVQNLTDAIQVKRDVVQADPFEQGIRATLNLGHTFGHAIEQVSQYQLRHGECVAIGLVAAAHLSAQLGHCTADWQPRIEAVLTKLGLPIRIPAYLDTEEIYAMMFSDKKKEAGKLRFILLRGVGDAFVTNEADAASVLTTLTALRE
jgi:3-dehydroquinate synthase